MKLTSALLDEWLGTSTPLWSRSDAEGSCVFVGLPTGNYAATVLPRKGGGKHEPGRTLDIELTTDAPALVRYELPVDEK